MDLDRFVNLLAALFGAMGSVYVLKAVAMLSPDLIDWLAKEIGVNLPSSLDFSPGGE